MSSSLPLQIAETIQTASLNRAPSPTHDLNPSTSASAKIPVRISRSSSPSSPSLSSPPPEEDADADEEEEGNPPKGGRQGATTASIPSDALRPVPRRKSNLPPLPDLRFEQSYLASLRGAEGWGGVGWITVRDQVFLPLLQGTLWTLALSGWRHWNRSAQFGGASVGSRIRRWWWGVNNWELPAAASSTTTTGTTANKGNRKNGGFLGNQKVAGEVRDYFQGQFGSAAGD